MERTNPRWILGNGAHPRAPRRLSRRPCRRPSWALLTAALLAPSGALAAQPAPLPSDGSVAFTYTRAPGVNGCSQQTEAEVRDLITGVVHLDPFVRAGQTAAFHIRVDMARPRTATYRATFSLSDKDGTSLGTTVVEDATCDGAHLKLAASIALLLQPRAATPPSAAPSPPCPPCPAPGCDVACRASVKSELTTELALSLRATELPRLREEARRELESNPPAPAWRAVISTGALLGLEVAAEPAPAFWLAGEARSERWILGLEARGLFPASAFLLRDGQSTVDLALFSGLLVPCVRWKWLAGCALVEVGGLWVAGPGAAGDPAAPFIGLGLRARVDIPLPLGLEARFFADAIGHVLGTSIQGDDTTGAAGTPPTPYTFDAPRRLSAMLGAGLAKVF